MNKLSEKEKILQEEAQPKEEKEKYVGKLENNDLTYAEMAKRLEETEAILSIAMKKLSENQKTIQEQAKILREK